MLVLETRTAALLTEVMSCDDLSMLTLPHSSKTESFWTKISLQKTQHLVSSFATQKNKINKLTNELRLKRSGVLTNTKASVLI